MLAGPGRHDLGVGIHAAKNAIQEGKPAEGCGASTSPERLLSKVSFAGERPVSSSKRRRRTYFGSLLPLLSSPAMSFARVSQSGILNRQLELIQGLDRTAERLCQFAVICHQLPRLTPRACRSSVLATDV
jgi:hypothetical protein